MFFQFIRFLLIQRFFFYVPVLNQIKIGLKFQYLRIVINHFGLAPGSIITGIPYTIPICIINEPGSIFTRIQIIKIRFSFYNRKTGKAVRLVLRPTPAEYQTKEERFRYLQDAAPASLFDVKPAVLSLPEKARLFQSLPCDGCGEVTAEHLLRLENGKKLCLDCFRAYNRFDV